MISKFDKVNIKWLEKTLKFNYLYFNVRGITFQNKFFLSNMQKEHTQISIHKNSLKVLFFKQKIK